MTGLLQFNFDDKQEFCGEAGTIETQLEWADIYDADERIRVDLKKYNICQDNVIEINLTKTYK